MFCVVVMFTDGANCNYLSNISTLLNHLVVSYLSAANVYDSEVFTVA